VAQAFDLAGITNTVGPPSFALLAKGEYNERIRKGVCGERTKVAPAASPPTLAKNARMGHPQCEMAHAKIVKGAFFVVHTLKSQERACQNALRPSG